jgi:cytochrome c-type biogenesis protein CcmH/NrfG
VIETRRSLALLLLSAAVGLAGCSDSAKQAEPAASASERERVRAFWGRLRAATDARIQHDCGRAAGLYEQALAIDPAHEDALYYLGQCRRELAQPAAARAAFERLVEVNPMSARGEMALGALLASPDPAEPMDLDQAERHLRRAHELNSEETGPVVRLGEVLIVAGRPDQARQWLEAALTTNPKSLEAAFLLGYLAWEEQGARAAGVHVRRVRQAATTQAPIKGVLGEGDRRAEGSVAAPPLSNPLGQLLFDEPVAAVRAQVASDAGLSQASLLTAWREARRLCSAYAAHQPIQNGPSPKSQSR